MVSRIDSKSDSLSGSQSSYTPYNSFSHTPSLSRTTPSHIAVSLPSKRASKRASYSAVTPGKQSANEEDNDGIDDETGFATPYR